MARAEGSGPDEPSEPRFPATSSTPRRLVARLTVRLLAFNLLLVFIPAAGLLYLDTYERELLDAQERAMVQQGRVLSAALSERGTLAIEDVERILTSLHSRLESRIRVVDADGRVLGDTSRLGPRRPEPPREARAAAAGRSSWLYRAGAALYGLVRRVVPAPPEPPVEPKEPVSVDGRLTGREVRAALEGRYGTTVRATPGGQRSVTLYSAIPIVNRGRPTGAVLVSQSTYRLLQDLYVVRLGIFRVCLASVAVAIVLSLLVATTIARPLRKLSEEAAAILDRRGRLKGSFRLSRRADEIGDLSRALHDLTRRLEEYQRFLESFAADVSHEFKNPLASIRSAAEALAESDDPAERRRFLEMAQGEVRRMERLLSDLKEMTRVDARLETESGETVSLNGLLERICEGYRLRRTPVRFELEPPAEAIAVRASAERLAQVFENILDNAASFSPPGAAVRVRLGRDHGGAWVTISDEGPGIPPEHLPRIFDRFFTWRPASASNAREHTGLGLAIVRTIVEGYGGSVTVASEPGRGATFTVTLPASRTGVYRVTGDR